MLRQLNNFSRFTTSSIKYAANSTATLVGLSATSQDDPALPSPQLIAYWINETQNGLVRNLPLQYLYLLFLTCIILIECFL